jgi:hypothetical protein
MYAGSINSCELQALFPIDISQSHSDAVHQSRFEVQQCSVDTNVHFLILGFQGGQKSAALTLDDSNSWVDSFYSISKER